MNPVKVGPVELETNHAVILQELQRLLNDEKFSSAPQMSAFLRYVVQETLAGNGGRIKAYTIGVDALGKPDNFDAQHDPSVRVLALRLRKALKHIYESEHSAEAIIELRLGSYAPEFYRAGKVRVPAYGAQHAAAPSQSSHIIIPEPQRSMARVAIEQPLPRSSPANDGPTSRFRANRPSSGFSAIALDRNERMKYVLAFLIVSALFYSTALKLAGDWRNGAGLQSSDMTRTNLPVLLLSMSGTMSGEGLDTLNASRTGSMVTTINTWNSPNLRKVSTIVSSSLVKRAGLSVAQIQNHHAASLLVGNDYMILFSESLVDYKTRVDAQIVRVDTGAVIMGETFEFGALHSGLTAAELERIDTFTRTISDPQGPVIADYCQHSGAAEETSCTLNHSRFVKSV